MFALAIKFVHASNVTGICLCVPREPKCMFVCSMLCLCVLCVCLCVLCVCLCVLLGARVAGGVSGAAGQRKCGWC